jgi:antitoxin HicB
MLKYSVTIQWSEEDDGFIATSRELPGLSAFGAAPSEALREFSTAADAYLESWKASGKPSPVPDVITPYSGQLRVRMPKSLHRDLAAAADNEGVSLNTFIVALLSGRFSGHTASRNATRAEGITKPEPYPSHLPTSGSVAESKKK